MLSETGNLHWKTELWTDKYIKIKMSKHEWWVLVQLGCEILPQWIKIRLEISVRKYTFCHIGLPKLNFISYHFAYYIPAWDRLLWFSAIFLPSQNTQNFDLFRYFVTSFPHTATYIHSVLQFCFRQIFIIDIYVY